MITDSGNGKYLPGAQAVLAACRGWPQSNNPVLSAARELAAVHESCGNLFLDINEVVNYGHYRELARIMDWANLIETIAENRRDRLITRIDEWIDLVVPAAPPTAPLHSETVGHVIDRLASLTVRSYVALANESESRAKGVHDQLGLLAAAYDDLVGELISGCRRLPVAPNVVETMPRTDGQSFCR